MPPFKKTVKKLPRPGQQIVLDAVEDILLNPEIGEFKKGDLEGFRVYKFPINRDLTLLAYKIEGDTIILYQVGPHENFYKILKRYLNEIRG